MELNVPTIAQRKAARRSQLYSQQQPEQAPSVPQNATVPAASQDEPLLAARLPEISMQNIQEAPAPTSPKAPAFQAQPGTPVATLDRDTLLALARQMGLELAAPKKLWIKHSFSVTPESKERFQSYCNVLGYKMQDALEEAFHDWFAKKEAEFNAVTEAKK